jgi:hypothetical protein
MRGGGGGDPVCRVTDGERKGKTSWFSEDVKTAIDGAACWTSAEVTAGGCCCAAQQEGRVWLWGAGFGQWLQEDRLGRSACRHAAVLSSSVSRQRRDASLCSVFFISILGRFGYEVGAFVESFSFGIERSELCIQIVFARKRRDYGNDKGAYRVSGLPY